MRTPEERREALARGAHAEDLVADALLADGWTVLARNWRGGGGELDLVVARDGVVRVVEVKARDPRDATGLDAVGHNKRRRLIGAANAWLLTQPEPAEVAFLVALVSMSDPPSIEWFDDAFDGS